MTVRQRERTEGSKPNTLVTASRPGQDTHLSVPRLLLRKSRATRVTSRVRLQEAWSTSLPREARVRAAFSQGT